MADNEIKIKISGDAESLKSETEKSKSYLESLKDKVVSALGNPLIAAPLVASLRLAQTSYTALTAAGIGAMRAIAEAGGNAVLKMREINGDIEGLRGSFVRFGLAVGAAGVTAWRGVEFETQFSNVKKVVNGTTEEVNGLADSLKKLSTEISVPLEQLTKVAVFGGQMGLPVNEVASFTELVSKMAVAFDIVPEEAAKSLGNLRNIYQLSMADLEKFGDQINTVADSANTSEKDILNVLNRAGGTAQNFGLLRGETVALSAAFLAMGRQPEVVGTSMQNFLMSLQNAPSQAKPFLEALNLMEVDAEKLANDIAAHPSAALDDFLAKIEKFDTKGRGQILTGLFGKGEDTAAIGDLINSLGEYHRLAGLASKDEIFTGSMAATFAEREKTVSAAMQRLKSAFDVFAITTSTIFLPAIRFVVDGLKNLTVAITSVSQHSPNLAGFIRIAAIIAPLGGLFRLTSLAIRTFMPGIAAAFASSMGIISAAAGSGVFAVMRAGFTGIASVLATTFSGAISRAVLAAGLLTVGFNGLVSVLGTLGSVLSSIASNPMAMFLAGLTLIGVRFSLATGFVASFSSVLGPLGSTLLGLVGGPIGLVISGLAFLAVKFLEVKDNVIQFGDQNTTLSEILSAVWRIIIGTIGSAVDNIKSFIGVMFNAYVNFYKNLLGITDSEWSKVKAVFESTLQFLTTGLKTFAIVFGGIFAGLLFAVVETMNQIVKTVKSDFNQLISLATAAGNSIRAAFGGNVTGTTFTAQLQANQQETAIRHDDAKDAIKGAFKAGFHLDEIFDSAINVTKERKDAFVSGINDEIARGRGSKSSSKSSTERRRTGGSASIPSSAGGDSKGGHGKGGHGKGGSGAGAGASGEASDMSRFEADLTAQKIAFERKNLLLEFSKEQEKSYWDSVIANYKGNDKTLEELKKKSADLDLQILRDNAKKKQDEDKKAKAEAKALAEEELSSKEDTDNALIQLQEEEAQQQLALGNISNAQLLAKQKDFESQRYQIALKALRDRTALLEGDDTVGKAKAFSAEKALGTKHAADMKAINHKMALDSQASFNSIVSPIKSAFGSMIQGVIQGTTTLKQGLKNMAQSIVLSFAGALSNMAIDAAAHWAWELLGFGAKETTKTVLKTTSETAQTGATIAGVAARGAAEFAGAAASKTTGLAMSGASIMDAAAKAAAGTYASVAQIPYVGWILAPPAAALAFVAVAGYKTMLSSKGGDYNVSEDGVRMIHEQETILPATIAAPMREFFTNGGIGNVGVPQQLMNNPARTDLANTAASSLAIQQSLIQTQQQQAKRSTGGTVVLNTKGGNFVHKDDVIALLKNENRNFRIS
jgi:TP901 family phage tail tape measure protein